MAVLAKSTKPGMGFQARKINGFDRATAAMVEPGVQQPGQPSRGERDRG